MGHISPFLLTSLRWLIALSILIPFAAKHVKSDWLVIKSKVIFLFSLGSIGFTLFNNMMYFALTSTSAINVAIIQSSLPFFVFVLNAILFTVKVNKFQLIGFPITIIGVVIITFKGSLSSLMALELNVGDALMVLAITAYGIYTVFLKNKPNIHWLSTMTVLASAALVSSIPFAIIEGISGNLETPNITGLSVVLYTAVFPSLLAQVFWIRSVELIGSNATSVFINLVPLLGSSLAVILLGEEVQMFHGLGFLLILSGIYIGQIKNQVGFTKA